MWERRGERKETDINNANAEESKQINILRQRRRKVGGGGTVATNPNESVPRNMQLNNSSKSYWERRGRERKGSRKEMASQEEKAVNNNTKMFNVVKFCW